MSQYIKKLNLSIEKMKLKMLDELASITFKET